MFSSVYDIRFKGLSLDGLWFEGLVDFKHVGEKVAMFIGDHQVKKDTVGQYIGMDGEGEGRVMLYIGDVVLVEYKEFGKVPAVIEWDRESRSVRLAVYDNVKAIGGKPYDTMGLDGFMDGDLERI
ncbi:hypothetical protein, partial [Bacillus mycoides]|uniref:hypothetical protein n=1 Tax=Bacillus mycoides TaxID=1405 RepID=UPI003A801AA8